MVTNIIIGIIMTTLIGVTYGLIEYSKRRNAVDAWGVGVVMFTVIWLIWLAGMFIGMGINAILAR